MKKDIETKEEIYEIIVEFYNLLLSDDHISNHFKPLIPQLEAHINTVTQFWSDLLFQTWEYKKNMFKIHEEHHHKMPINPEQFDIWRNYLVNTIQKSYSGNNTERFLQQIESMITMMKIKMK